MFTIYVNISELHGHLQISLVLYGSYKLLYKFLSFMDAHLFNKIIAGCLLISKYHMLFRQYYKSLANREENISGIDKRSEVTTIASVKGFFCGLV